MFLRQFSRRISPLFRIRSDKRSRSKPRMIRVSLLSAPEQTQTSMANVAASDNSAKQQLSPENVNDTATQNKTAKSLDAEKPLPAKEPLNLAGKWEGFFQCGPHFYDQSPRGQRSFNVKAAAEITGGKSLCTEATPTIRKI